MPKRFENVTKAIKVCCGWCTMSTVPDNVQELRSVANVAGFSYPIKDCLNTGHYITIRGTLKNNTLRFAIDFVCNQSSQFIAFHFNPRLEQRYVVRNCLLNGQWGDEETTSLVKFDFAPGEKFVVNVLVTDDEYMVSVNGKHYCAFTHRVPARQVTSIEVRGKVSIDDCKIETVEKYPVMELRSLYQVPFDIEYDQAQQMTLTLDSPFTGILAKGFRQGWQLEIYGKIKILPHSFYVNLQNGPQMWPHPTIPLHLNPRFNSAVGANTFVRNAWLHGWRQEERAPTFPFAPGHSFCLVIRIETEGFSVWIDGKMTGEFICDAELKQNINTVYIQGDIFVNHVVMRTKITDTYFQDAEQVILTL